MKAILSLFIKDKVIGIAFGLSVMSFLLVCVTTGIAWVHLAPYLPVFLKLPWGYDRVGTRMELLYPLGIWFLELVAACIVISPIATRVALLGRMVALSIFLTSFFFLIFLLQIVRIGV